MKKRLSQIFATLCLTVVLSLPYFVLAQTTDVTGGTAIPGSSPTKTQSAGAGSALDKLQQVGTVNGPYAAADSSSLATIVGSIISVALSLLGILFITLIVVYGYKWMSAGGDEKEVDSAKTAIKNAVIGLVVTVSAYAIWGFVSNYLLSQ